MKIILADALTIAAKDLRNELKSKQTSGMMIIFSSLGGNDMVKKRSKQNNPEQKTKNGLNSNGRSNRP